MEDLQQCCTTTKTSLAALAQSGNEHCAGVDASLLLHRALHSLFRQRGVFHTLDEFA